MGEPRAPWMPRVKNLTYGDLTRLMTNRHSCSIIMGGAAEVRLFESSIKNVPSNNWLVQIILNQARIVPSNTHSKSKSIGPSSRLLRCLKWVWGPLSVPLGMGTLMYQLKPCVEAGQATSVHISHSG
jgi:hypothetical protein